VLPIDQMPPSVELSGHGGQLSYGGVCGGIVEVDGMRRLLKRSVEEIGTELVLATSSHNWNISTIGSKKQVPPLLCE